MLERYRKILEAEGVDFLLLKDKEFCCGSPVKNAGAIEEYERLAKENFKIFRQHNVTRVISNCPACTLMFKKEYPKILGDEWRIEARHVAEIIDKAKTKLKTPTPSESPPRAGGEKVAATYHDPCHLGRHLGIYDQPREIIKKAGYQLVELDLHGEKSFCCGGGGGVSSNDPELSNKIAKDRIGQAKMTGADVLITSCPMCYMHLKRNNGGIKVMELSELFDV